ncbi:Cytochrome P450 71C4 [Hordeum vulgare]|nr:Cytochrome P450 71C4 [Hordeum vulgare]
MAGSFQNKGKAPVYHRAISPSASSRRPRQRVSVPVHQAWWHSEHRVLLPYPDVTLPHRLHLDPERIPVPTVPRSARLHAEKELWFAVMHEEHCRRGVHDVQLGGPPPPLPVVSEEDQEAQAAYQAALTAVLREREEE